MKKVLLPLFAIAFSLSTYADDTKKTITLADGSTLEVVPAVTMKVAVDGETERTFSFGSYKEANFYAVDFGDGELKVTEQIGQTTSTASTTAVSGVAKGDGTITVYADDAADIWYFSTAAGMSTTTDIQSIDFSKLTKVQQIAVSRIMAATVDLSACDSLRNFTSQNGELTSIDFSGTPDITSINVMNNKLTSVNVKNCSKLDLLNVQSNELTEMMDLSNNPNLSSFYVQNNKLTSIKFAENNVKFSNLYLSNNLLTELTVTAAIGTFEADNNKLAKISLVDCTKSCKLDNNCFTIATLPQKPAGLNSASKIKKFTYAGQAPLQVENATNGNLDLSAQLTAKGELEEGEATTVYAFVDAEGNALAEGTDYVVNGGVASFLKAFTGIHGVMTTDAFPKATGDNAFVTTAFDAAVATGIKSVDNTEAEGAIYTVSGAKVAAPVKGINIKAGKKFIAK